MSLKKGNFVDNKDHDDSSALISTLNFLARSCLSATPKVDSSNLMNVLGLCTSLSDESIQGIVSGFESVQEVKASQEDHTSHVKIFVKFLLTSLKFELFYSLSVGQAV